MSRVGSFKVRNTFGLTVGPDLVSAHSEFTGVKCNIDTSSPVNVECVLVCKFYGSDRVFTRVHLFYSPDLITKDHGQ